MLLNDFINTHKPDLQAKIEIFTRLAEKIDGLHRQNTVHNDLHPGSIHIDSKTRSVELIPSNLSFSLAEQDGRRIEKDQIKGQIAYLSPERTGRTAHCIDFRSDLYCLGVLLYEALTGTVPFHFEDPAQTLHGHVAVTPDKLHGINGEVPGMLSDITLKLLSKNPADRYQTAGGLAADLSRCLCLLKKTGCIAPFPMARKDLPVLFEIPNKLYGRHAEIKLVMDEYRYALNGGVGTLFFTGPPGIGKSHLVGSTLFNLTNGSGTAIQGKFDQYEGSIPYSGLCAAFTHLAQQILTLNDSAFDSVRADISKAVGNSGQIIIEAVPEMVPVMGKQPQIERLSPSENENRFNTVILRFIKAVARSVKPLILFLDDLHWADSASLNLIRRLLTDKELSHLLFIGCYRDMEAEENAALNALLNALQSGRGSHVVQLASVDDDYVGMLMEDLLSVDADLYRDAEQFILRRTGGNPLFIKEFIHNLHAEGCIRFTDAADDSDGRRWQLDMERVRDALMPDTLVNLLNDRFLKQPSAVQDLLKIAACAGTEFEAALLAKVTGKKIQSVHHLLHHAVNQGMVIKIETGYKFMHDRVRETAYRLNRHDERAAIHYAIGTTLKKALSGSDQPDEKLFLVVSKLNLCRELLTPQERHELIVLSLKASRRARAATAYANAWAHVSICLELLPADYWQEHYALALTVHTEAAKAATILGDINAVKQIAGQVEEKAEDLLDIVKIHESLIWAFSAANMHTEAIHESLRVLKRLGLNFPENPGNFRLLREFAATYCALWLRRNRSLNHLKDAREAHVLAASRIMQILFRSVQASNIRLYILLVFKGIKLSLKYGITPDTAIRIAVFGGLLCGNTRAINTGYRFGQLALALTSRPHTKRNKAEIVAFIDGSIRPWKHHLRESLAPMLAVYNLGIATGSAVRLGAINWYCSILFFTGERLQDIVKKIELYNRTLRQFNLETFLVHNNILLQALLNLTGLGHSRARLSGDAYNEEKMVPLHISANDQSSLCKYHIYRMYLNYSFGNYDDAVKSADEFRYYLHSTMGTFYIVMDCFYDSLSRLAVLKSDISGNGEGDPHSQYAYRRKYHREKRRQLRKVAANQRRMKRWARHAPMNIMNKWALVEAERTRIVGTKERAMALYQQAITSSAEYGYLQEEALAYELLARFHFQENAPAAGTPYIKKAHRLYAQWGAMAKCHQIEKEYGKYISPVSDAKMEDTSRKTAQQSHTPVLSMAALAVQMLVDASTIITNQNEIETYFTRLSDAVMKYSGAQRVLLLINRDEKLSIGVDHRVGAEEIAILKPLHDKGNLFSESIIKYVMRTRRKVLLDSAHDTPLFSADPYVRNNQLKSVICLPVQHDQSLLALMYIENNLNYGVFGTQNDNVLQSICDQIALSFENRFLKEAIRRLSRKESRSTPEALMDCLQKDYGFTPQEAKVASLFKEGHTRAQICEDLNITLKTLRRHLQSIYNKTINEEDDFNSHGRIDKLSRLILFLFKIAEP